ncbi:GT4 family glycosyltransferase PelF [Corynebacterium freiburgense]|uniref:GT4 family glycosyltransferase PelF n=1 Tax=Corynebacterium freiburgense TaxID=556548 RepID=UPI00042920CC|nr:GT4 family glycosyltransferase PelF [Corynebacterium freiburgense]WJZ01711.1 Lipopolysaccharide core biosynthesis protein RfaG [Corynebacterium freiburgense]
MSKTKYRFPGDNTPLEVVDVAIVMESTYPYLTGGVSAVVHDIVTHNPDLTFGIIHIAWDSNAPSKDLYGVPSNVAWVDVLYLSLEENREGFQKAVNDISGARHASELVRALQDGTRGDPASLRKLYIDAVNPQTRSWRLWSLLPQRDLMEAVLDAAGQADDIKLDELFWMIRDFFSLMYALLDRVHPPARVYHAHTTGYASLVSAAAALQNNGKFLLTEHNLYVQDTINTLLERSMNLPVTLDSPRDLCSTTFEWFWVNWWIRLGALLYPMTDHITYLYPRAIDEAKDLGGDPDKSEILPNGIVWDDFEYTRRRRQEVIDNLPEKKVWRLVSIARVVPIKGIIELIDTIDELRRRGVDNVVVDVLGPTNHLPEYYEKCLAHIERLGLQDKVILRGSMKVRDVLHDYDALILASFNEGQPIVVLEAMVGGLPVIGTRVGGMDQMVIDPLLDQNENVVGPCGDLAEPGDITGLADIVQRIAFDKDLYMRWHHNSLARPHTIFLMEQVMVRYNAIYRRLGAGTDLATTRTADLGRGEEDIAVGGWERRPRQSALMNFAVGGVRRYFAR